MNTLLFVLGYVLLMLPTYVLPYFGSNSFIGASVLSAATEGQSTGFSATLFLAHAGVYVGLIALTRVRGTSIGRNGLFALPLVAAVFDLVPLLSSVPLVPTVLLTVGLVLGCMSKKD